MTTERNENSHKPSGTVEPSPPADAPACEPDCCCGKPAGSGNKKIKIALCLAVIVAVSGILLIKTINARQNAVAPGESCCPAGVGAPSTPCK